MWTLFVLVWSGWGIHIDHIEGFKNAEVCEVVGQAAKNLVKQNDSVMRHINADFMCVLNKEQ